MFGRVFYFPVFFCLLYLCSSHAAERDQGHGRINMQGSIIDTACAIAVDSRDQVIDMGVIPFADILREGHSKTKHFTIQLINCVLTRPEKPDWHQFQVTFDGKHDGQYFGVNGDASGISLRITDENGYHVIPGKALPLQALALGERNLNYTLTLMPNQRQLRAGEYFATLRFKLDYF